MTTMKNGSSQVGFQQHLENKLFESFSSFERTSTSVGMKKNDFIQALNELKDNVRKSRIIENNAFINFSIEFERLLNDSSVTSLRQNNKIQSIILTLREQNKNLLQDNHKLRHQMTSLLSLQKNCQVKLENMNQNCITKVSHQQCLSSLNSIHQKYEQVYPKVSSINKSLYIVKTNLISKLLQAYKTYKNLYNIKVQAVQEENISLKRYKTVANLEMAKFTQLENRLKMFLLKYNDCTKDKSNWSKAVNVAKSYKSLLFSRQEELEFCQSQHNSHKNILRNKF